eukprot:TRINITY_DN423_c0_g1_i8.p2 TRINITY_DN423_c0_g1~~TRINITY_DN423_c0_g1_i8.p2  ORF type:complete len:229 (+),score=-11.49 TRINITY_DN423_c0_g1_i8:108-794(+)
MKQQTNKRLFQHTAVFNSIQFSFVLFYICCLNKQIENINFQYMFKIRFVRQQQLVYRYIKFACIGCFYHRFNFKFINQLKTIINQFIYDINNKKYIFKKIRILGYFLAIVVFNYFEKQVLNQQQAKLIFIKYNIFYEPVFVLYQKNIVTINKKNIACENFKMLYFIKIKNYIRRLKQYCNFKIMDTNIMIKYNLIKIIKKKQIQQYTKIKILQKQVLRQYGCSQEQKQ